jgi:dipeptidyl-peptidase-4
MKCSSALPLLALAVLPLLAAPEEDAALKHFRDLAETRNFSLGRPASPKFTPDGAKVIFLRGGPRDPVLRLYELDLATRRERELITPAQLLGGTDEKLTAEEKRGASGPASPRAASPGSTFRRTAPACWSPCRGSSTW